MKGGDRTVTDDWQPIDTAPRSTSTPVPGGGAHVRGAYFLGYCPDESATDPVSCICICWWEPHIGNGKWWGEGDYELRPTHWMPLPDPPSALDDLEDYVAQSGGVIIP